MENDVLGFAAFADRPQRPIAEVKSIKWVVYDHASKPPGTIERE